jgi:hypothetical protein
MNYKVSYTSNKKELNAIIVADTMVQAIAILNAKKPADIVLSNIFVEVANSKARQYFCTSCNINTAHYQNKNKWFCKKCLQQ